MNRTIGSGEEAIEFLVKRSRRRRTVALQVAPSGIITVYAPYFVWGPFIDRFVQKQQEWIRKKLAAFRERPEPLPIPPALRAQFTQETEARLIPVIARNAETLGVRPTSVRVANQAHRWGSCSARGKLRFSWRMARLPDDVFDYIVIHELAHLVQMNHSPSFWAVVQSICPDFKSHRSWLRKNAPMR